MQQLPRSAQLYIVFIYLSAIEIVAHVSLSPHAWLPSSWWRLSIFLILAALAGSKKISLTGDVHSSSSMSMSLGFTVTFAAMLSCGPVAGMITGVVSCIVAGLKGRRQTAQQLMFNVSLSTIETYLAGMVFLVMNGSQLIRHPVTSIPALCASCLTYFIINTVGVSIIIALCTNQKPDELWRKTFSWTAPSYFAGASVSTLAVYICGAHVLYFALFLSPVIFLTFQSYTTNRKRAIEQQKHVEELQQRQVELADLYLATIKSLALAIDAKDQYTHQHIIRVQRYSVAIAVEMGLSGDELEGLTTGALLHDIGKLGVPEYVLLKPGRLTDDEFAKIKKHPEIGAAILGPVEFPWPVLPVVKYHHEKWDGTGYPEGLKGEDIPLTARILAVGDVYDALTSSRSYRGAWEHERALQRIKDEAGIHFDPQVVEAFLKVIDSVVAALASEQAELTPQATSDSKSVDTISRMGVREIQQASSELWALYEVAQSLSSSLGLDETLNILARKLEAIVTGAACLFLLFGDSEDTLSARNATGINIEFFRGSRTINQNSASMKVAAERKSFLGDYDSDDLLISSSQDTQWTQLQSALIVPILHEGKVLGTINLYHPLQNAFSIHDLDLLQTIAERAAMAIYNGLMFDRTRSHAMTDPLTGLYNFRYLTQVVDDLCKHPDDTELFSMLCVDLDDFKPINDNFGHQKGDEVLRDLGIILRGAVRETDIVARYGGDEFLIVLNNANREQAEFYAKRVQAAVESYDPKLHHQTLGSLRIGASLGLSCFPDDGIDCTNLLSMADNAMYRDKTERKLTRLAEIPSKVQRLPKAA